MSAARRDLRWRKPRADVRPEERSLVVNMRDGGATWHEIGRAIGRQESYCRTIYMREKAKA